MESVLSGVRAALASRRVIWMAAAVALVLSLSALGNGLVIDDFFHRHVALEGRGYFPDDVLHPLDMFAFMSSGDEVRARGVQEGLWPWWISEFHIRFFRPLSAATHVIDYRLFDEHVWLMHLHSGLWYACLAAAAATLFRQVLGTTWCAGLAALLYAVDDRHAGGVGWLASRNMVIATTFGVLCLVLHHRARHEGWAPGRWLAPIAFGAALLSAEFGLGCFGYLVAYAAIYERGPARTRLWGLAPYLVVLVAWLSTYTAFGYGASGSGLYTHPLERPGDFVIAMAERWPVLTASQLTVPVAEGWLIAPVAWSPALAVGAFALLAVLVVLAWSVLGERRDVRFLVVGAALALVPCCTTFPNERLLFFAGLGGAALVASLAERVLNGGTSRTFGIVVFALVLRHTVLASIAFPLRSTAISTPGRLLARADTTLPEDAALTAQTLVVVNTPHTFLTSSPTIMRRFEHRVTPHRLRTLGASLAPVAVTRLDERTLEISTPGGYGHARVHEIFWERRAQRPAGYRVALDDVDVEVTDATPDGRHRAVRFRFSEPLESPRWRWVTWVGDGYVAFEPPPVGTTNTLPAIDLLDVMSRL